MNQVRHVNEQLARYTLNPKMQQPNLNTHESSQILVYCKTHNSSLTLTQADFRL